MSTSGCVSPSPSLILSLFLHLPFVLLCASRATRELTHADQDTLGTGGQVFMTIICILGLFMNTVVAIVAASRLVFAIARDGILPGSSWIGKVGRDGVPRNAVTFIMIVAFILLCTILGSQVAFTSLISCGAVPTIAAYGLIPLLRLINNTNVASAKWRLGRWSKPFCIICVPWCGLLVAVLLSPTSCACELGGRSHARSPGHL